MREERFWIIGNLMIGKGMPQSSDIAVQSGVLTDAAPVDLFKGADSFQSDFKRFIINRLQDLHDRFRVGILSDIGKGDMQVVRIGIGTADTARFHLFLNPDQLTADRFIRQDGNKQTHDSFVLSDEEIIALIALAGN